MTRRRAVPMVSSLAVVLLTLVGSSAAVSASAAEESAATLRARGFAAAYNLDYDEALAHFRRAIARDPNDAPAHRGVATVTWLTITSLRGVVCVEEFMGSNTSRDVALPPPPPELAERFRQHATRAVEISQARARQRPNDAEALYQYGASVGLVASYTASVEGRVLGAFRSARSAFDAHERVLSMAPERKDAGLVAGTYRYFVSTLPRAGRWMAYLVGFGGGREAGLQLLEHAAAYPGDTQDEAKLALVLLYNREQRYDDAQQVLGDLRRRLPRNRLLWLEAGATALRAGQSDVADTMLMAGRRMALADERQKAFGEEALWHYYLGTLRLRQRQTAAAVEHFTAATRGEARTWVRGRAHLGLGRLADLAGDRDRARREYDAAIRFAREGRDSGTARQAERHLQQPFR
jgi:tetratricopeptide (TPR) repeat protein